MRKLTIFAVLVITSCMAMAQQNFYMVSFTDKNDTQFDPYSYFDAKAIARYEQCGAKTRLSYTVLGMMNLSVYGSYRFTDIFTKNDEILGKTGENPSPWNIGLEIELTF